MSRRSVVVVGHGAAGLAAALATAKSAQVTIVDRAPEGEHGGGTRWSPSYMRMNSPGEVSPAFVDDIAKVSDGLADRAYFSRLAAEAPATIAWLEAQGVAFHQPVYYLSAGAPRIQPVGGGAALLEALTSAARRAGIAFLYGQGAKRLVPGAGGAIAGVEFESGRTLSADAVVLACGGFEGNPGMLREHFGAGGESLPPLSPGSRWNTGTGITMALEAGAQRAGDWNGMHIEPVDARSKGSAPVVLVYPYGIVVDRDGRRFFDEGAGLVHETWEKFARELHFAAPGRMAWAILDSALLDIPDYGRAIRSEIEPVRAGSLSELAAETGIALRALEKTIAEYNVAANGDQAQFDPVRADDLATAAGYTPPKSNWARPLQRPPYLAWPLVGAIAYTFGGLATDADARVLGQDGPIPGLYAAGEITGHFHHTAPNAVALLRALVFGRVAGMNAIR